MKKTFLTSAALLFALSATPSLAQTETTWADTDVNAAKGATVYVNELHSGATTNITDDDLNTSCQVRANGDNNSVEWVIIDLGYEYDLSKISITTSGDRYDTGFAVYGSAAQTTAPTFANGTDALDGSWGDAILSVENTGQTENGTFTRTYTLSASKVRYLKYLGVTRGTDQTDIYGFTMNELRVVGTTNDESAKVVASISATYPSLTVGNTGDVVVTKYNANGGSLGTCDANEVTVTSSDESVVSVSGLTLTGVAEGTATISVQYGELESVSQSVTVDKNWDADDVLSSSKTYNAYASSTREGEANSVVGKAGTFSTNDPATDTEQWWFVDLGRQYNVTAIGLKQTNTYAAEFEVYTASALTDETADVSNDNVAWSSTAAATGTCSSDYYTSTVSLNAESVRFIKIHATQGGGLYNTYGMAIQRFYLDGTVADASMTVGEANDNGVVACTGDWVETSFLAITGAKVIDLTALEGLPTTIPHNTNCPNAIVYAPSTSTGVNVCTGSGANVADLQLTDGYDFAPESWMPTTKAQYTVKLSANHYSIVYLPFKADAVPENVHLYSIASTASSYITISEVTDPALETAYIIKADKEGTYTFEGSGNCGSSTDGHNNGYFFSSMVKTTVPTGAYMFNKNGELAKVTGSSVTLHPFAGYITAASIPASENAVAKLQVLLDGEATGINATSIETNDNGAIYDLSGRRVSADYKGLVIKNGKKLLVK